MEGHGEPESAVADEFSIPFHRTDTQEDNMC
jgi:hypothetical protein